MNPTIAASRNRFLRAGFAVLSALSVALIPTTAKAACGSFGALTASHPVRLPMIGAADDHELFGANPTIVGLWHVIYTASDGTTFNDTFDLWHSDGTEFESAFLAPVGGNVCVGVWKPSGPRSVTLHHIGWLFNPATPNATATNSFTLDENNTVSANGKTYTGTFTFKIWNLDGTFTGTEIKGTIAATRVTVD